MTAAVKMLRYARHDVLLEPTNLPGLLSAYPNRPERRTVIQRAAEHLYRVTNSIPWINAVVKMLRGALHGRLLG